MLKTESSWNSYFPEIFNAVFVYLRSLKLNSTKILNCSTPTLFVLWLALLGFVVLRSWL